MTYDRVQQAVEEGALLLDVRTPGEFAAGTISGAVNFPVDALRASLAGLPKERTLLIFCKVGLRGYIASRILREHGFINCVNLSGGYETYSAAL
jgi:rhodanese-related sulfurtransferase